MAADVKIRLASITDAWEISRRLRSSDIAEIWRSSGQAPLPVIEATLSLSVEAWAGMSGENLVCLFGVGPLSMISGEWAPWMVSAQQIESNAVAFLRRNKAMISRWRSDYGSLANHVDAENETAIRWLSWLGARFDAPVPFGPFGHPFLKFHL